MRLNRVFADLTFALRTLRRSPEYAVVATISIGLGIGVATVVFGQVEQLLRLPPVVASNERLVAITADDPNVARSRGVPGDILAVLERQSFSTLDKLAAASPFTAVIRSAGRSRIVSGEIVSGTYFELLNVRPGVGRALVPDDDSERADLNVVISDALWSSLFNKDPAAIGSTVTLGGSRFNVVGVAPSDFGGLIFSRFVARDFWVTRSASRGFLVMSPEWRASKNYAVLGKLRRGATQYQAAAELGGLAPLPRRDGAGLKVSAASLRSLLLPPAVFGIGALALIGVSGLVWIIGLANLSNLLFARAEARSGEFAIRIHAGATQRDIVSAFMVEVLVLAIVGGGLGILAGCLVLRTQGLTEWVMRYETIRYVATPSAVVVAISMCCCVAMGFIAGLSPARQAAEATALRQQLSNTGTGAATSSGSSAFRSRLVSVQLAASVTVCIWTGLLLHSALVPSTLSVFDPNITVAHFNTRFQTEKDGEVPPLIFNLQRAVSSIPEVTKWMIATGLPTEVDGTTERFETESTQVGLLGSGLLCRVIGVTGEIYGTLGIRAVAGETEVFQTTAGLPNRAVISQSVANALWPGKNAIGQQLRWRSFGRRAPWLTVVGVASDVTRASAGQAGARVVYVASPLRSDPSTVLAVRTSVSSDDAQRLLQSKPMEAGSTIDLFEVGSLREQIRLESANVKSVATGIGVVATIAILLASAGVFSSMAITLRGRRREIGIIKALGATPLDVYLHVTRSYLIAVWAGIGVGVLIAMFSTRTLSGIVQLNLQVWDTQVYLLTVAAIAGFAHAVLLMVSWRTMRSEPARSLAER